MKETKERQKRRLKSILTFFLRITAKFFSILSASGLVVWRLGYFLLCCNSALESSLSLSFKKRSEEALSLFALQKSKHVLYVYVCRFVHAIYSGSVDNTIINTIL